MKPHNNTLSLLLIFLLLLVLPLTIAEDLTITPTDTVPGTETATSETPPSEVEFTTNKTASTDLPTLPTDPKEGGKVVLTAAQQAALDALKKPANKSYVEQLKLPNEYQGLAKAFFGIEDEGNISLEMFLVLISLFMCVLVVIYELMSSLVENRLISLIISGTITIIGSLLGSFYDFAQILFSISDGMQIISLLPKWYLIVLIVGVIVLVVFLKYGIKKMNRSSKLESSERSGSYVGSMIRFAKRRYQNAERMD